MSLTTALSIAQTALLNTSRQTSIVSRNISEANNPDYARRSAAIVTSMNGSHITQIRRATSEVLFRQNLAALSSVVGQDTMLGAMNSLNLAVNGSDNATSPARLIGKFQEALQSYSASPSNGSIAENAVEAARQVVKALNNGTTAIQSFRSDMDRQILGAVGELNSLLSDFEQVNREIVSGTQAGRDVNDALDQRDALLKKISEFVPVSVVPRAANDMALVTASGAMLFDVVPRTVTFDPVAGHSAGVDGNPIRIDGVPLPAGTGGNTSASGKLAAMLQMRDDVAGGMQAQLDETARGLIAAFSEKDPDGILADAAGLFTWPGAPAVPADGVLVDGLAGLISINAAMDSTAGGNPHLLRDGGANGADYIRNTEGGAGFTSLLIDYQTRLESPIAFDNAAGLQGTISVVTYSEESVSWFEGIRQSAQRAVENKNALYVRTDAALSNMTGVNIDEELTLLLDLEHSYQASARLMSTVDAMLGALMDAIR